MKKILKGIVNMMDIVLKETVKLFRSYEIKCEEELIKEWLETRNTIHSFTKNQISEDHVWAFEEWRRWKGTAYEEGINDQTKIVRLIEEMNNLKNEIEQLRNENESLKEQFGIMPF